MFSQLVAAAIEGLNDPVTVVRAAAVAALRQAMPAVDSRSKAESQNLALEAVIRALSDPDMDVRMEAAYGLELREGFGALIRRALGPAASDIHSSYG
jgi:HEAT repeat protein